MHTTLRSTQAGRPTSLSIGDLADATGLSVGTLRMWETRHGFPRPERLGSGHRRYSESEAERVREVLRHREAGARLDAAIARVTAAESRPGSAYAEVLRRHPEQPRQPLRKSTLIGLSWALEDEIAGSGQRGHLFGAFQRPENFEAARARWADLARTSLSTYVMADFSGTEATAPPQVELVHLPQASPMHREWTIVCDSPVQPVALTAWELPGQDDVPDRDRVFESVWTADPGAVRTAARTCAGIAADAGNASAAALADGDLAGEVTGQADPLALSRLAHRVVAYVERTGRGAGR